MGCGDVEPDPAAPGGALTCTDVQTHTDARTGTRVSGGPLLSELLDIFDPLSQQVFTEETS